MPRRTPARFIFSAVFACLLLPCVHSTCRAAFQESVARFDVVVYGGTSAGVIAAVEAQKSGKSVVIVGPDQHLGGMSASGLGFSDTGNKATIGGLSREFYHRVYNKYQKPETWKWERQEDYGNQGQGTPAIDGQQRTQWIFEPHVAEGVFEDFVTDYKIPVLRDHWLDRKAGVTMDGQRIRSIRMTNGKILHGKMFIDATYEGDLLAAAGVDFHVGREANATYGEKWNGSQTGVLHHGHHFKTDVSPYRIPGDPASGLVFGVSSEKPAPYGEEDHRVQAYCYRMCLTDHDENRLPFPKPEGYNADDYLLMLRVLETGWRDGFRKFDPIPNRKTDTNNHGPFSTDFIGENYDYPEASYAEREKILQRHIRYQQGLMYFLANDARVPDDVRTKFNQWGLAADEFTDNGGWPHQIYVREARRMVGQYVMTEADCFRTVATPQPIGMGSYTLDSHNVQRYIKPNGFIQNEGDIGVGLRRPYQIAYGSLIPKDGQCENLLVPVCASSSHIAFGSIRMEPVFMIMAHSAAAAACLAIDQNVSVQKLPYKDLRQKLESEGQILDLGVQLPSHLPGTVLDDSQATVNGDWQESTSTLPFLGHGYLHDGNAGTGDGSVEFRVTLPQAGRYEIRLAYSSHPNRSQKVEVDVQTSTGKKTVTVNQRKAPDIEGQWVSLGTFDCPIQQRVTICNRKADDGYVIADAIQWLPTNE